MASPSEETINNDNENDNDGPVDAIIIGSGLAGLTTALTILDAGGKVIILEKESKLGGNSMKASSGINAVVDTTSQKDSFRDDTLKSAGRAGNPKLIEQLVQHSHEDVLGWLRKRLNVDLSQVTQLGGHSQPRTHRPGGKLPIGAEIMIKLQKAVKEFEKQQQQQQQQPGENEEEGSKKGNVTIITKAKACQLIQSSNVGGGGDSRVVGVVYEKTAAEISNKEEVVVGAATTNTIHALNVVLATGGFASDRTPTTSWLSKVRPELLNLGATAGEFSTGDGLTLATGLGAGLIDMEHIQVHPTGFVDPKDPNNPNKFLAAEILRGVGGILLTPHGKRFCNEIGRRDYVTDKIFSLNKSYAETKKWNGEGTTTKVPQIYLLLSEEGATEIQKHVDFYVFKGFLTKVEGYQAVAEQMTMLGGEQKVEQDVILNTLQEYQAAAAKEGGIDEFGKDRFVAVPKVDGIMYVGKVEPVLHYCMGGVQINPKGQVLKTDGKTIISGLYAGGEVAGGTHGENRLAGNSLCECVVFGRIIGQEIVSCGDSKI